jgi:hypothetical protein
MHASSRGDVGAVTMLLEAHADVLLKDLVRIPCPTPHVLLPHHQ